MSQQEALEQLDRQWKRDREQYLVRGRGGVRREPRMFTSLVAGGILATCGSWLLLIGLGPSSNGMAPTAGGILLVFSGLGAAWLGYLNASQYEQARRRYALSREKLLANPSAESGPIDADRSHEIR